MAIQGYLEGDAIRFTIELMDSTGNIIEVDALFDTGFTAGVLAIHRDDIEALGWPLKNRNTRLPTASGIGRFDLYEGTIVIDGQALPIPVLAGILPEEDRVLLGSVVLRFMDLTINTATDTYLLTLKV
ncbi:MAG: aspartyl protease [Cyanobacteria bacterium J06592_8]